MSDIEVKNLKLSKNLQQKNKLGFLALEYLGHGKSSGKFIKGNISIWTQNTKLLIKKIVKKNNFVLIGSSMGLGLHLINLNILKNKLKDLLE